MSQIAANTHNSSTAPYPGSHDIPRWNVGELPEPPRFTSKNWFALLGPGLLMGAGAIGGGEWLVGPMVTAKFGGGLLYLAALAIFAQVTYNIEISRYALYSGEPIFTGKFRTLPGPIFWVWIYILLDFGMFFPYLASNAAVPLVTLWRGAIPDPTTDELLLRGVGISIFLLAMVPLVIGGKIYNILKILMTFKLVVVLGFLLLVAVLYSHSDTWREIGRGFFQLGNIPVIQGEDRNDNGILDPGEDWDKDGHLDVVEKDLNGDGQLNPVEDLDHDGTRDGSSLDNVFLVLFEGRAWPRVDLSVIGLLAAMVAIAGGGGLGNTPISNYTRDQGWGMGAHVGAIPSIIGGRNIKLSHVGTVFLVTDEILPRWRRWYRHVARDQLAVWLPACLLGVALPSMLSVEFLKRGYAVDNEWLAAVMTADALRDRVGTMWGKPFWWMTIFCGFLVLGPSCSFAADGFIRRWVDIIWTTVRPIRQLNPQSIRYLYFAILAFYVAFGIVMLSLRRPESLLLLAALFMNFAMGFSMWHALWVNCTILPPPLRPGWFLRIALFLAGLFYWSIGTISTITKLGVF